MDFQNGFTLMELLIVIILTALLATFAWPLYQNHLLKARRIDGQMALIHLASKLESYFAEHQTYITATIATGLPTDVLKSSISSQGWYDLSVQLQEKSFVLKATPILSQAQDKQCQSLTLDDQGLKNIASGPLGIPQGNIQYCW